MPGPVALAFGQRQAQVVLAATIVGSGMALIDATIVNVALPAIDEDLGAGTAGLTWTVNAYTLTLASLILLEVGSWRWVFLVNLPFALTVLVLSRHIPESRDEDASSHTDVAGVAFAALRGRGRRPVVGVGHRRHALTPRSSG